MAVALASAAFVAANLQPTMKLYFHLLHKVASFPQDYMDFIVRKADKVGETTIADGRRPW
jgi:hypothetical protein